MSSDLSLQLCGKICCSMFRNVEKHEQREESTYHSSELTADSSSQTVCKHNTGHLTMALSFCRTETLFCRRKKLQQEIQLESKDEAAAREQLVL